MKSESTLSANIPPRRYLTREEAAEWLGLSVDTFDRLRIPYCEFGPRSRRWDILDIQTYAEQTKTCDSVRTDQTERKGRTCVSSNARGLPSGGSHGLTRTESDIAEVLELKTSGRQKP